MSGVATVPGRGRKPKPTARKIAAGNPGKRALNKDEPDFGAISNIDPPDWMTGYAADMWKRVAPRLCAQKVLQWTDVEVLETYCSAYKDWRRACEDLDANGLVVMSAQGSPMKNPAETVKRGAFATMRTAGALLGLDPVSRQRLSGVGNKRSENPFGALLGG
ncbi:Phage terminase, small subunit [Caballeronia pedi]|uniref:Phage terminase, small subunit n=1 Tax=Caballeronia pedi TaxID=1777141 RepID=A0A158BHQ8_9BURK|nr:phage terminase small subunit P27 family [Caballeronia pedi]SAK69563.1 Phage terminase, small subunit [Caballeronia pedi]